MVAVTIKPLFDLNFTRYMGQCGSYMPSSPSGSISPGVLCMQLASIAPSDLIH